MRETELPCGNSTRQKVTSVIRVFWAWLEEHGRIALSPATRIRRPRAPGKIARTRPTDARTRLLEVARHPRDRLALFCPLALGMRREELARVRDVEHVDLPTGQWPQVTRPTDLGRHRRERRLLIGPRQGAGIETLLM